jgi:hypothetical protein
MIERAARCDNEDPDDAGRRFSGHSALSYRPIVDLRQGLR